MRDPVVTADGQTYEREAIERWISNQQGKGQAPTSPLTGAPRTHEPRTECAASRADARGVQDR